MKVLDLASPTIDEQCWKILQPQVDWHVEEDVRFMLMEQSTSMIDDAARLLQESATIWSSWVSTSHSSL